MSLPRERLEARIRSCCVNDGALCSEEWEHLDSSASGDCINWQAIYMLRATQKIVMYVTSLRVVRSHRDVVGMR